MGKIVDWDGTNDKLAIKPKNEKAENHEGY